MELYNTLTRTKSNIQPLNPPEVTVYTCGPTVYDYPHIGNWFTFIRYDVLIRALKISGLQPKWVMNITDVGHLVSDADDGEDKLEKGAKREGKTAWDVADYYSAYFIAGLERLNITAPTYLPKATKHIEEQIALVQRLEAKGFTYVIDDGVYFDTNKFPSYANFAQLDLNDQKAGARIELNPQKRHASDFALWKFTPAGQKRDMEWQSPWGKGFPGWHLECSAMAMQYLGETIDIHAGGIDHIPVHHTNEIAQSEAATGKQFAHTWMHTNHITVEGEKISKSLGNGITLEDIESKDYSLAAFRLLALESHYRTQSKFSWDALEAAQNRLAGYKQAADRAWQTDDAAGIKQDDIEWAHANITFALTHDLETPIALAKLSEILGQVNDAGLHADAHKTYLDFLAYIDAALGITLVSQNDINSTQKQLIAERNTARATKDWTRSDEIRDQLLAENIGLRDTEDGSIWYRL